MWQPNRSLTEEWAQTRAFRGPGVHMVRCGADFAGFLDAVVPAGGALALRDPADAMYRLLHRCVPRARDIFTVAAALTIPKLFHMGDYIMEKAFVYAIVCLSKWLGEATFPQGVYSWPPALPEDMQPNLVYVGVGDEDGDGD